MTYGGVPDFPEHDATHWDLRPAMTLRSKIIGVQQLQPGDTVGYGSAFTAEQPMRIGIVACGYADGYPRHAGTGTPVLVDGHRTRTLGRVSMDMLAVDLSPVPKASLGSEVTRVLNEAGFREDALKRGIEIATSTPEQLGSMIKSEMATWQNVINRFQA